MLDSLNEKEVIDVISILILLLSVITYAILHLLSDYSENFNVITKKYTLYFQLFLLFFVTISFTLQNINDKFPIYKFLTNLFS